MLLKSGIIVAFFTLLSRVFGLARELFIAATFGTSMIADCVNVAFKFPNLFRRIFGEGALSAVFIPIFNDKLVDSRQEARKFSGEIFTLLIITLTIITLIMQLLMPYLMVLIAPGFYESDEKFSLAITLCRITMPYLIFVSATALFGGMLNSIRKFAAFAFVPILMNISVILVTTALKPHINEEYGIAYSLIVAGILQVSFMYYCLWKNDLIFPIKMHPANKDVKKLVKNMGPASMSSGVQQLNLFISHSIASFLPGAVSILSYADRLYQLPLALIGITFGTILLPELSRIYKKQDFFKANRLQNKATQIGMLIAIPAMIGLLSLSYPIIHVIYERGEFTAIDTIATSEALMAFSLGLPAYVLSKILTPIFYANQDTRTPFRITVYTIAVNTILNITLMFPFGHVGIAAGSSIAAWYNVYLLNKYTRQYGNFQLTTSTKFICLKVLFCSLLMGIGIYIFREMYLFNIAELSSIWKILLLFFSIIVGIIIFAISAVSIKIHKNLLINNEHEKN